jgi:hypothetical protein
MEFIDLIRDNPLVVVNVLAYLKFDQLMEMKYLCKDFHHKCFRLNLEKNEQFWAQVFARSIGGVESMYKFLEEQHRQLEKFKSRYPDKMIAYAFLNKEISLRRDEREKLEMSHYQPVDFNEIQSSFILSNGNDNSIDRVEVLNGQGPTPTTTTIFRDSGRNTFKRTFRSEREEMYRANGTLKTSIVKFFTGENYSKKEEEYYTEYNDDEKQIYRVFRNASNPKRTILGKWKWSGNNPSILLSEFNVDYVLEKSIDEIYNSDTFPREYHELLVGPGDILYIGHAKYEEHYQNENVCAAISYVDCRLRYFQLFYDNGRRMLLGNSEPGACDSFFRDEKKRYTIIKGEFIELNRDEYPDIHIEERTNLLKWDVQNVNLCSHLNNIVGLQKYHYEGQVAYAAWNVVRKKEKDELQIDEDVLSFERLSNCVNIGLFPENGFVCYCGYINAREINSNYQERLIDQELYESREANYCHREPWEVIEYLIREHYTACTELRELIKSHDDIKEEKSLPSKKRKMTDDDDDEDDNNNNDNKKIKV